MIVRVDPDYLEHASKSKYKGGFTKDGKNTPAYNHDYYMKNKEKWKDNDSESPNPNPFGYEDKYEQLGFSYSDGQKDTGYWNKQRDDSTDVYTNTAGSRKRNGGKVNVTDSKTMRAIAKKEGVLEDYQNMVNSGEIVEVKSAKVQKRGEGIGGGPSGTKDYRNRSSVSVNKRKKGRKPVGKVWTAKY